VPARRRRLWGARAVAAGVVSRLTSPIRDFATAHPWWLTALLGIGIVTSLTVVNALFLGADSKPTKITVSDELAAVDSPDFIRSLANLVNAPVEQGGTVEILNNGAEFLPALLQAIDGATRTINFSVYIWEDGVFSDQVLDALVKRQLDGVAVRVLLDGLGARKAPYRRFKDLEKAGGQVQRFRTPRFGSWTRFHRRNHRRAIVMDGKVGFVGGMAIGDSWLGAAHDPDHWRDMMFRVTGPLAISLQAAFVGHWVASSGEILAGAGIYPPAPQSSTGGVEAFIHHVNSPADDDQSMAYFYLLPILAARQKVYIATPYFIPDEPLRRALQDRARVGVDVRLLLPGPYIDNNSARYSGQNHYDALIATGVRIFEYRPTFIHSKFVLVDGRWSIIGSPNLNSRSRQLDEENAFGILDYGLGEALEATFLADLGNADEIDLATWRRRGPLVRMLQLFSRVLDQQS
jgi:cardiolipin synthase A/B